MPKIVLPLGLSNKRYLIPCNSVVDVTNQRSYLPCKGVINNLRIETLYYGECYKLDMLSVLRYRVELDVLVVEIKHNAEVILITCKELLECDE